MRFSNIEIKSRSNKCYNIISVVIIQNGYENIDIDLLILDCMSESIHSQRRR